MLHNITIEGVDMAVGESGRIVVEMDPEQKKVLYQYLKGDGLSLKDWFLNQTKIYLDDKTRQKSLFDKRGRPMADKEGGVNVL